MSMEIFAHKKAKWCLRVKKTSDIIAVNEEKQDVNNVFTPKD